MAEHATLRQDDSAKRVEPAPARRGPPHTALERRAPMRAESALARLLNARPAGPGPAQLMSASNGQAIQRKLNTNGAKIAGAASLVKKEVNAVIGRDKPSELLADIALLETSIAFRKEEQLGFNPKTDKARYDSHTARISMEESQRKKLQKAYDANKARRDKAKAKPALAPAPVTTSTTTTAPATTTATAPVEADEGWTEVKSKK